MHTHMDRTGTLIHILWSQTRYRGPPIRTTTKILQIKLYSHIKVCVKFNNAQYMHSFEIVDVFIKNNIYIQL